LTNLLGAFAAADPALIRARKIVLCDDICTTGGSLHEAVRALREAGAKEIICLTYLRTDLEEENLDDEV
jgi:predicted amidophosphoribosyltransferase